MNKEQLREEFTKTFKGTEYSFKDGSDLKSICNWFFSRFDSYQKSLVEGIERMKEIVPDPKIDDSIWPIIVEEVNQKLDDILALLTKE